MKIKPSTTFLVTIVIATLFIISPVFFIPAVSEVEPGIGFSTATELKSGSYSFYMEGGRNHFFKVWLNVNQILHIIVRVPVDADFDVYLLSPEREVVERSTSPRGYPERISYQASSSGYYYIVVVPYLASKGTYGMQIAIYSPPRETVTTTATEAIPVYVTLHKPTVVVTTITKTVYEVETVREVEYIERFPWMFMGLVILAASIIVGTGLIAQTIRATK
jgi:hypothetical protein